jgi:hypothetical protein
VARRGLGIRSLTPNVTVASGRFISLVHLPGRPALLLSLVTGLLFAFLSILSVILAHVILPPS